MGCAGAVFFFRLMHGIFGAGAAENKPQVRTGEGTGVAQAVPSVEAGLEIRYRIAKSV